MRRQLAAAFAGFCVACTIWVLSRSGAVRVPDIHFTIGNVKPDPAEPQEPNDPVPLDTSTSRASTGVIQFASLQTAEAPALSDVRIGTDTVTLPSAPTPIVIMLVGQPSTPMAFTMPAGSTLKISRVEFGSTTAQTERETAVPAGAAPADLKKSFSFSQPGDYSLELTATANDKPAKFRVVVVNAVNRNGTYSFVQPGLINEPVLTAGTDGTGKTLTRTNSGLYVSDGPNARLKPAADPVVKSPLWKVNPELSKNAQDTYDIVTSGKYDVTLEDTIADAFVDGEKQSSVDIVSTQSIELRPESSAASFEPTLLGITQALDVYQDTTPTTAVFETLPENLLGKSLLLNDSSLVLNFQPPAAGRKIGIQSGSAKATWNSEALTITNVAQGAQALRVGDVWAGSNGDSVNVNVTATTRAIDRPRILTYSEAKSSVSSTPIPATGAVSVTGKMIHLSGIAPSASEVELLVLNETSTGSGIYRKIQDSYKTPVDAQGLWNVAVSIAEPLEPQKLLVAVATGKSTHRYSKAVTLTTGLNDAVTVRLGTAVAKYKSPLTNGNVFDQPTVDSKFIGDSAAEISVASIQTVKLGDKLVAVAAGQRFEGSNAVTEDVNGNTLKATVTGLKPGKNDIRLFLQRGSEQSPDLAMELWVVNSGPQVKSVEPVNFGTAPGQSVLRVRFSPENPLEPATAEQEFNYVLVHGGGQGQGIRPSEATFDATRNEVALKFASTSSPLTPDIYELRINGRNANVSGVFGTAGELTGDTIGIRDRYKNLLDGSETLGRGSDYSHVMTGSGSAGSGSSGAFSFPMARRMPLSEVTAEEPDLLTQRVGLPDTTGPPVDYMEFTKPRKEQNGFNPSDKVVSRVARTYYFRDAHRLVQIINRRVKSYNAQNATMSRQLADKARLFTEQTVDRRQEAERQAVEASGYARQAENMIQRLQSDIQTAETNAANGAEAIRVRRAQLPTLEAEAADPKLVTPEKYPNDNRTPAQRLTDMQSEIAGLDAAVQKSQQDAALFRERSSASVAAVDALRERELEDRETMNREQAKEDRAIDHQFRLEVQAARSDPDTYAPGIPDSDDPVAQVSMSVIGEGLIQMRGPLKGVNIIHTMINEIDSPVGQVRVGIHTVQINGEKGSDMEEIAVRIQRYTDHSRFLTSQSAQMLRNAVSLVASRKAQECGLVCDPGVVCEDGTIIPAESDGLPVVGMNGMPGSASMQLYQDAFFGAEFMSELRAMDSEFVHSGNKLLSLHSMDSTSLASSLFLMALASNQTRMEILDAFQQSTMYKLPVDEFEYFEASDTKKWYHFKKFKFMADNARFVSLRGYFDSEIVGDTTLNPAQREFVKLAQILKSRLITEIELKQRVVERALIEERVGDYQKQLKDALAHEQMAQKELTKHQESLQSQIVQVLEVAKQIDAAAEVERERQKQELESRLSDLNLQDVSFIQPDTSEPKSDTEAFATAALAQLLGLGSDLKFKVAGTTLRNSKNVVDAAHAAARDALWQGDLDRFYAISSRLTTDLTALVLRDTTIEKNVREHLVGDPGDALFTTVTINYGAPSPLELRIKLTTREDNHIYSVNIRQPQQVPGYHKWILGRADAIQASAVASDLPPLFRKELETSLDAATDFSGANADGARGDADALRRLFNLVEATLAIRDGNEQNSNEKFQHQKDTVREIVDLLRKSASASIDDERRTATKGIEDAHRVWVIGRATSWTPPANAGKDPANDAEAQEQVRKMGAAFSDLLRNDLQYQFAAAKAEASRRPLDHKKFLDMLIDEVEEKNIQLLEGTRAHTAVIDDYVKRICTALEDDFNAQFYDPAFRKIREETYRYGTVSLGQIEHTSILTNNREFAKVQPQATMEFDLPRRRIMVAEAMGAAQAAMNDYGALMNDPNFLALTKLNSGQSTAPTYTGDAGNPAVRDVLPGLPSQSGESAVIQARNGEPEFASQLEALIPDPAIYKFETGTGFEIRPVIQPDGQSIVFDFNYMYTTNIREPVDADEKHLGRVKRHFIDTDVQIGNYELREVSRYRVALKAERSGRGVPLLEDVPVAGALFRPMNNGESSLQQNIILAQTVIYPTLFDLMGLRWAPAVADLDIEDIKLQEFTYRSRMRYLKNEVYDYSSAQVDEFLRIPQGERRPDLYRPQVPIPIQHPNGYMGPGNDQQDSTLQEGYEPRGLPGDAMVPRARMMPGDSMVPGSSMMPGDEMRPGSHMMPGEGGIMIPPVECAPLLPIQHGASNQPRPNPSRPKVTQTAHRTAEPTSPTNRQSPNAEKLKSMSGKARFSNSSPSSSGEASDRQKMPPLEPTPQQSTARPKRPSENLLQPQPSSERGSSSAQSKPSAPISRMSTNSGQNRSGRATLQNSNDDSTSLKEPATERSKWRLRIPGTSNSGK